MAYYSKVYEVESQDHKSCIEWVAFQKQREVEKEDLFGFVDGVFDKFQKNSLLYCLLVMDMK
jgi:hypothetical protein